MKRKNIVLLVASFLFVATNGVCMEKKIIPALQKKIIIPCIGGTYELKTWEVFASNSLFKHCLQFNKNFESVDTVIEVPKIPISYEKMDLFSKALDVASIACETGSKIFKNYLNALTQEQQRTLIIAAGQIDEHGKRQFNAPELMALIVQEYFDENLYNKHIRPLLERGGWLEHCCNKLVNNNIMSSFFPSISFFEQEFATKEYKDGSSSSVPLCLAEQGSLCDSSCNIMEKVIQNVSYHVLFSKKLDGWEHCTSLYDESHNKIMIWAINTHNNNAAHTIVEHRHPIWQFFFSNNGEYVVTASSEDVFVSRIMHQENGSSTFDTYRVDHDEFMRPVCFDHHTNCLITCSAGDTYNGIVKLFNISGACMGTITDVGIIDKTLLSPDGSKLMIISKVKNEKHIILCTIANSKISKDYDRILLNVENLDFDRIVCSPNGNHWAITTIIGGVIFFSVFGEKEVAVELVKNSIINQAGVKLLFSSDNRFLIALVEEEDSKNCMIKVWSTGTGELITSQYSLVGRELDYGIGLTSHDRELVIFYNKAVYRRPFFCEESDKILNYLFNSTTIYELILLRRLYRADKNKEIAQLYEEESAYKALINLQKKSFKAAEFIKKYLPYEVIDNKKSVVQLAQEAWKNIFS